MAKLATTGVAIGAALALGVLLTKGVRRAVLVRENVHILTSVDTGSVWTTES